ncbi:alpha-glucosidase/alpha-galactosidase [bacterium]|nr:alpha-glucosidase/alpha-galactosidase [bacterium]
MGDIVGPGGVFRGIRTIPVLLDICREMKELCPDAYLFNYVNPMAINTRALYEIADVKVVGICHSVVGTTKQLAGYLNIPFNEITYFVAGINHMAWYLKLEHNGKDLYPELFKQAKKADIYNKDMVRFDIMKNFGYFVTESSCHFSEYVLYFRKDKKIIKQYKIPTKLGYQWVIKGWGKQKQYVKDVISGKEKVTQGYSGEYAADIIHSLESGQPRSINLNVKNNNFITNLPNDACVEIPCLVDGSGIHPVHIGDLPPQLAALDRININVHELASKGALSFDREVIFQAIALDPNTSSVLSLPRIREMVDEMFEVEKKYLRDEFYD